jgi:hypothetical protein
MSDENQIGVVRGHWPRNRQEIEIGVSQKEGWDGVYITTLGDPVYLDRDEATKLAELITEAMEEER